MKRVVGVLYLYFVLKYIFQIHMVIDKSPTSLLEIMGPVFCAVAENPSGTNVGMMFWGILVQHS